MEMFFIMTSRGGEMEIDNYVDADKELRIDCRGRFSATTNYINKEQSIALIKHLQGVFDLEGEQQ